MKNIFLPILIGIAKKFLEKCMFENVENESKKC